MAHCPGCNPTLEELNAVTAVVFPDVYDRAFEAVMEVFQAGSAEHESEVVENPGFILAMKTVLDTMLPQAIHARLHNCGPVVGHRVALS